jgi:hypothetical protein
MLGVEYGNHVEPLLPTKIISCCRTWRLSSIANGFSGSTLHEPSDYKFYLSILDGMLRVTKSGGCWWFFRCKLARWIYERLPAREFVVCTTMRKYTLSNRVGTCNVCLAQSVIVLDVNILRTNMVLVHWMCGHVHQSRYVKNIVWWQFVLPNQVIVKSAL